MQRDIWVILVHYVYGKTNISNESYTSYEEAVDKLSKRVRDGHWVDDFNYVVFETGTQYQLKTVSVNI
jgi:hypothetical protein